MTKNYDSELDYLVKSLDFLEERYTSTQKEINENKEEMENLKIDIRKIQKSARLQKAATKTFNHWSKTNTGLKYDLEAIREDRLWVRRLIKIVQEWLKNE